MFICKLLLEIETLLTFKYVLYSVGEILALVSTMFSAYMLMNKYLYLNSKTKVCGIDLGRVSFT